jgi:hypothetical protein
VIARFTAHHQDSMRHWLVHIFNLPVNVLEHELLQIFGAETLSWWPNLTAEIKLLSFPHKW